MRFDIFSLKLGIQIMSPIIPSILVFALIFGYTGGNAELSFLLVWSTSFIIFAGTAQFFIILAIMNNDHIISIIITAVIINLRHLLYGAALYDDIKVKGFKKILVSYFLTDEVFIVASELKKRLQTEDALKEKFKFEDSLIGAGFFAWLVWNVCTILGYIFSDFLSDIFTISSEFIVAGTFLGYLVMQWKNFPDERKFILQVAILGFCMSFWFQSSILLIGILFFGGIIAMSEQYRINNRVEKMEVS